MKKMFNILIFLCLVTLALYDYGHAVPGRINFQGRLTDASNKPSAGLVNMRFRILDGSSSQIWPILPIPYEAQTVPVFNGVFSVQLGLIRSINDTTFSGDNTFLEVAV